MDHLLSMENFKTCDMVSVQFWKSILPKETTSR
jgi:hypothetical protein